MFNTLENIIKKCEGNILTVCLDQKLMSAFDSNNKINLLAIQSTNPGGISTGLRSKKSKKKKLNGSKNINIKKLRKYINKKSVDTLFCNMNEMYDYYKFFIKDSIYLCNNTIYVYFDKEIDVDFIIDKYNRYKTKIEKTEYKNGYLLKIDVSKAKTNWFKDRMYLLHDSLYNLIELIGNILVS